MPKLVSNAYNAIAVGLTDGDSSYGPTVIDVSGRVKPDIVVPIGLTMTIYAAASGLRSKTNGTTRQMRL